MDSYTKLINKKSIIINIAVIAAAVFPIILFFINIHMFAVNIPYNDDYNTVFGFMNAFSSSHSFIDRFNLVFSFWNDHRQPFNKIVTLVMNMISGNINIKTMIYIGNAGLLIIIFCLYKMFQSEKKMLYFLPAIYLFFQPGYAENIFFGMASLTNFYVMSFGYLAVFLLTKREKSLPLFVLSLLFSTTAYFTQRNGILFLGIGLLILLYQKNWMKSAAWAVAAAAAIIFYQYYPGGNPGLLQTGFKLPVIDLHYFFNFIGNTFGASTTGYYSKSGSGAIRFISSFIPLTTGILTVIYFVIISIIRFDKINTAIYSVFLFLLLSAAGASVVRAGDLGLDQAFTSRYRVVTIQFIMMGYLSVMEIVKDIKWKKIIFTVSIVSSVLFCAMMYKIKYAPVLEHRKELITSLHNWQKTGTGLFPLAYPGPAADKILNEAVKNHFYRIPDIK